ncbi:FDXHR family putative zinc-binding protein [Rhodococcus sp. NPDC054953]
MDTLTPAIAPPKNAIWHGACGQWWTGAQRAHASCCHRTFSSLSAFDRHRKGLTCNDPAEVGLVARPKPFGELWGWPAPEGGYAGIHADESAAEPDCDRCDDTGLDPDAYTEHPSEKGTAYRPEPCRDCSGAN